MTGGKPLLKLLSCDCRWPVSGSGADMRFCAQPVQPNRSYCGAHCRRAGAGFTYRGIGKFADSRSLVEVK